MLGACKDLDPRSFWVETGQLNLWTPAGQEGLASCDVLCCCRATSEGRLLPHSIASFLATQVAPAAAHISELQHAAWFHCSMHVWRITAPCLSEGESLATDGGPGAASDWAMPRALGSG